MAWIAGVDGCKGGWIAVYAFLEGGELKDLECHVERGFEKVMACPAPLAAVAVDMPIGLCDDKDGRACDKAARGVLGKRSSSIFSAPAAGVIDRYCEIGEQLTYDCAKKLNEELTGKGLSRQSWALVPKIAEVYNYLKGRTGASNSIHEVHPEVSFAAMNAQRGSPSKPLCLSKGHEMRHPKKTLAGFVERRALLERKEVFENGFEELEANAAEFDADGRGALDDFYDALACLWTVRRVFEGVSLALPCGAPPGTARIVY